MLGTNLFIILFISLTDNWNDEGGLWVRGVKTESLVLPKNGCEFFKSIAIRFYFSWVRFILFFVVIDCRYRRLFWQEAKIYNNRPSIYKNAEDISCVPQTAKWNVANDMIVNDERQFSNLNKNIPLYHMQANHVLWRCKQGQQVCHKVWTAKHSCYVCFHILQLCVLLTKWMLEMIRTEGLYPYILLSIWISIL